MISYRYLVWGPDDNYGPDSIVNKIIVIAREMGEQGLLLAARWLLAVSMTFALLRGCRALTPPGCPVIKGEPTLPRGVLLTITIARWLAAFFYANVSMHVRALTQL